VYIGKADLTDRGNSLRKRVSAYLRFGAGSNARHSGGYPTWQLSDSDLLLIAWRVVQPPRNAARRGATALFRTHQRVRRATVREFGLTWKPSAFVSSK